MKLKRIIKLAVLIPIVAACDDMFEPTIESIEDFEAVTAKPANALGLMSYGYQNLPYQGGAAGFSDMATDDAVCNDFNSDFWKVGNGLWSSKNGGVNPFNQWTDRRINLQYVNRFLEEMDNFTWAGKDVVNAMFKDQVKGEAYALRALQLFYFLRNHAGYVGSNLVGVPFLAHSETAGDNFNVARSSFKDCIDQIFSDLDVACEYLPYDYADIKDSEIPAKYKAIGVINSADYNRVFGETKMGRMSGRIAAAIKAQVALFAASPAYSDQSGITWEDAAKKAADVLNEIGGPSGIDQTGNHWYNNLDDIRASMGGKMPAEIIWRGNISEQAGKGGLEESCYPASLSGKALVNPTQNLVDAFPMANGYPITAAASGYDPQKPYEGRDPRFDLYIVHDGSDFGPNRSTDKKVNDKLINTTIDDNSNIDGLDATKGGAPTRTGYFMRKLLNEDAALAIEGGTGYSNQLYYYARIRYTEIFLDYAEAANEAYGPKGTVSGASYSAYDVIKAIRERAGITDTKYLDECAADKDKMRELIHNERRIELCFEGHRFWDLRRWKANLNEQVKAMEIKTIDGKKTYTVVDVKNETRNYDDCMYYGPVPESEINKWSALQQNDGWEKF